MAKKTSGIVQELRKAIKQAGRQGVTRYRIAQVTGLSEAMLSRFMGGAVPKLDTAALIAKAIGRPLMLSEAT